MTAPTLVRVWATQASATAILPSNTSQAAPDPGDLCVIMALSTQTASPNSTISYNGGGDAGFTHHGVVDGTGTTRSRMWSKVLTADDFTVFEGATLLKQMGPTGWVNNGTSRLVMYVFRHADGWGSDRLLTYADHNSNVTNGSNVATTSDTSRAAVGVTGITYGSAQTALVIDWDDGSTEPPYVDESSSTDDNTDGNNSGNYGTGTGICQAHHKLYDTTDTPASVGYSVGLSNTTHATVTAWFRAALPVVTAQGRGDTATDARGQGVRIRTASGLADTTTDAYGKTIAPIRGQGRGDTATDARGQGVRIRTASGLADTTTDGRGVAGTKKAPADTTTYAYGFPNVTYRAGGRGDTVTAATARQSSTQTAGGRGDTTTQAGGLGQVLKRAFGFADTSSDARATAPARNITVRLGRPGRRWTPGNPGRRSTAGLPGRRWTAGKPQD